MKSNFKNRKIDNNTKTNINNSNNTNVNNLNNSIQKNQNFKRELAEDFQDQNVFAKALERQKQLRKKDREFKPIEIKKLRVKGHKENPEYECIDEDIMIPQRDPSKKRMVDPINEDFTFQMNDVTFLKDRFEGDDITESEDTLNEGFRQGIDKLKGRTQCYIHGSTEIGESVCIRYTGYKPFFYLSIEESVPKNEEEDRTKFSELLSELREDYSLPWKQVVQIQLIYKLPVVGFRNGETKPFMEFVFSTMNGFKKFRDWLKKKFPEPKKKDIENYTYQNDYVLTEDTVDHKIKLANSLHLQYCGWVRLPKSTYKDYTNVEDIVSMYVWEANELKPQPERKEIAPFILDCLDIEQIRFDEEDAFPDPTNPQDAIAMICHCLEISDESWEPIYYIFTWGGKIDRSYIATGSKSIFGPRTIIKIYQCEADMLNGWAKWRKKFHPDIWYGWNTYGYDFPTIIKRIHTLEGIDETTKSFDRIGKCKVDLIEKNLSSSALKYNKLFIPSQLGGIPWDLLILTKKDVTFKPDDYKLDTVAKMRLGLKKKELRYYLIKEKFFGTATERAELTDYNWTDVDITRQLFVYLLHAINDCRINRVPLMFICAYGQQQKLFSGFQYQAQSLGYLIWRPNYHPIIDLPIGSEDSGETKPSDSKRQVELMIEKSFKKKKLDTKNNQNKQDKEDNDNNDNNDNQKENGGDDEEEGEGEEDENDVFKIKKKNVSTKSFDYWNEVIKNSNVKVRTINTPKNMEGNFKILTEDNESTMDQRIQSLRDMSKLSNINNNNNGDNNNNKPKNGFSKGDGVNTYGIEINPEKDSGKELSRYGFMKDTYESTKEFKFGGVSIEDIIKQRNSKVNVIRQKEALKRKMFDGQTVSFEKAYIKNGKTVTKEKGFSGGYVIAPILGIFVNVCIFDFSSLYPSIMISYKLASDNIVLDPRYANCKGISYMDVEFNTNRVVRFAQQSIGVMNVHVKNLLDGREIAKKIMGKYYGKGAKINEIIGKYGKLMEPLNINPILINKNEKETFFSLWKNNQTFFSKGFDNSKILLECLIEEYKDLVKLLEPIQWEDKINYISKKDELLNTTNIFKFLKIVYELSNDLLSKLPIWSKLTNDMNKEFIEHSAKYFVYIYNKIINPILNINDHIEIIQDVISQDRKDEINTKFREIILIYHKWLNTEEKIYNSKQNSLKVAANSAFGAQGAGGGVLKYDEKGNIERKGMFSVIPVPAAVTYIGRRTIITTQGFLKRKYNGVVIYGDTDSVMIKFPFDMIDDSEQGLKKTFDICPGIAEEITEIFKFPGSIMKIIHEKSARKGIFYGAKCYIIDKREKKDQPMKVEVKGLSFNKRDCCSFVTKLCKDIVQQVFIKTDIKSVVEMVDKRLEELVNDTVDWNSLVITRVMSKANYCGKTIAHVELTKRIAKRTPGLEPKNGEAVKFIHYDIGDLKQKNKEIEKIEELSYAKQNNLKIDIVWYLENQIRKNVEKIFAPIYPEISSTINKYVGIAIKKHWNIKKGALTLMEEFC